MNYGVPVRLIPLNDGWFIIVTSLGRKYYYNRQTGENSWVIDLGVELDKDDLLLIIAWCRGLRLTNDDYQYLNEKYLSGVSLEGVDSVGSEVEVPIEESEKDIDDTEDTEDIENIEDKKGGLITEYTSSDDDSDDEVPNNDIQSEGDSTNISDSSVEGGGVDFDIDSGEGVVESSDEGGGVDFDIDNDDTSNQVGNHNEFKSLFDDYKLNPMGSFELQVSKLINDPRFFDIDDMKEKKLLFDEWAKEKLNETVLKDDSYDDLYDSYPILEIIDYLNLKYESLDKKLFLFEFKKKFNDELKRFNKSEFDKVYKKFIIYHFEYDKLKLISNLSQFVTGKSIIKSSNYYDLIKEINLINNDKFMNYLQFQCLSNNDKYKILIEITS